MNSPGAEPVSPPSGGHFALPEDQLLFLLNSLWIWPSLG